MFDFEKKKAEPKNARPVQDLPAGLDVNTDEIEEEVNPIVIEAKELTIQNNKQCDDASVVLKAIKKAIKDITAKFEPSVTKAYEAHKAIKALENEALDRLKEAEKVIKGKMGSFVTSCWSVLAHDQIDADEDLKKQVHELKDEIAKARNAGETAKADKLALEHDTLILSRTDVEEYKPPKGISLRDSWDVVVIDADQIPKEYLVPDLAAIKKVIQATKGQVDIPGISAAKKKSISVRVS